MAKTCTCSGPAFCGTPEQEKALKDVIAKRKGQPGALMIVMQEA